MRSTTKIALAVGTALALGLAVAEVGAHGTGWGGGYGMGYGMHGGGPGYGMHGAGPGYGMHGGGMGYGMGPMGMFGGTPEATEEQLAGLKSDLAITTDQDKAWQAFVTAAKQQSAKMQAWFTEMHQPQADGTVPDRLARHDAAFAQHQAVRQATTSALKDLYAALTPEQKAIADQRLGGFGPGRGRVYGALPRGTTR